MFHNKKNTACLYFPLLSIAIAITMTGAIPTIFYLGCYNNLCLLLQIFPSVRHPARMIPIIQARDGEMGQNSCSTAARSRV